VPTQQINGLEMSYTDRGLGPTLVLLHGFPLDSRVWHAVEDHLEANFRIVSPDLRGFGRTASETPFTIESLADDVHALLAALKCTPCILGGLSMGGYVALAYAKKYPSDLKGFSLIDTKSAADTEEGKQGRMKMIELVRQGGSKAVVEQMFPKMIVEKTVREQPAVVHALRGIMSECPPKTIEQALLAMRDREDFTALLPTIKVPSLVIVGDGDAIAAPDLSRAMQAAIPGSQLAVIPNAGHMAPIEQPEAVADALAKFFTSAG
jgi:pimeloyl-ACP methyl ester carboxylesterase